MSGYIGTQPIPQATQTRQTFTATASQTSFATGGYQAGYIDVFLNGVKLVDGTDYTATNGSDVVLTTGAASGDTLEVVAYTAFEVLNQNFTGGVTVDNDAATVLTVDRATSDGVIQEFRKDGTTVGSINSRASAVSSIVLDPRSSQGAGITGGGKTITPTNESGSNVDADIDLGQSVNRWKDLYLSGGVYLGGTGSANKLDDYETGTWTPSFSFDVNGTGITYGVRSGRYVKVGDLVTIMFTIQVTSTLTTSDYFLRLVTPFVGINETNDSAKVSVYNTSRADFKVATQAGSGSMLCYATNAHNDYARGDDIPAGTYVSGVITYHAA